LVYLLSFFVLHEDHPTFLSLNRPSSILLFWLARLLGLGLLGQFGRVAKLELPVFEAFAGVKAEGLVQRVLFFLVDLFGTGL
jgi:hypothetical protein